MDVTIALEKAPARGHLGPGPQHFAALNHLEITWPRKNCSNFLVS
jgi:hypothetical protein